MQVGDTRPYGLVGGITLQVKGASKTPRQVALQPDSPQAKGGLKLFARKLSDLIGAKENLRAKVRHSSATNESDSSDVMTALEVFAQALQEIVDSDFGEQGNAQAALLRESLADKWADDELLALMESEDEPSDLLDRLDEDLQASGIELGRFLEEKDLTGLALDLQG